MAAVAMGDQKHLRCLLYAGLVLTAASCLGILRHELRARRAPGRPVVQVVDISSAPSVALLAAENTERIDVLKARADITETQLTGILGAMARRNQAEGFPVPDKEDTQPIPRLKLVGRSGEASLCSLAVT
jgi:hypothetical protein